MSILFGGVYRREFFRYFVIRAVALMLRILRFPQNNLSTAKSKLKSFKAYAPSASQGADITFVDIPQVIKLISWTYRFVHQNIAPALGERMAHHWISLDEQTFKFMNIFFFF